MKPFVEAAVLVIRGRNMGVLDFLGLLFIVLKLTGVIGWSWIAVLAPFWIPVTLVIIKAVIDSLGW